MLWRCGSWPQCLHSWRQGLVWSCIMMVEVGGYICCWTASGVDRHLVSVERLMEIYEMISCEQVLPSRRSMLSPFSWLCFCVCRSPAGMIEGTPQLHANAWKVSSACVAPVNLPIIDPCEMNQHNGNNAFFLLIYLWIITQLLKEIN